MNANLTAMTAALDFTFDALGVNHSVGKDAGRVEFEIWRDHQSQLWFQFDGVSWRVGIPGVPDDVRRAFLAEMVRLERQSL